MAIEPEDLIELLEGEGFRTVPVSTPLREIVMGLRVRSERHPHWPLTLRVYTGILPEFEDETERAFRRGYHDFGTRRYLNGTLPDEIRSLVVWRSPSRKCQCIGVLPRIRPDAPDPTRTLLDYLENWPDVLPPECPGCGNPMLKRKPQSQPNWEWFCVDRDTCGTIQDGGPFLAAGA